MRDLDEALTQINDGGAEPARLSYDVPKHGQMNKVKPFGGLPRIDLGELARRILVHERPNRIKPLAVGLDLLPAQLLARLRRGRRFRPEELVILFRELPDERLVQWLFAGTGLLILTRPAMESNGANDVLTPLLNSAIACLSALSELVDGLDDVSTKARAGQDLLGYLDAGQSELLQLRLLIVSHAADTSDEVSSGVSPDGFASLVRRILLDEGRIRAAELAKALGLSYFALRSRITGGATFAPEEIRRLFQLYPEPRLADFLLAGTPFIAIPRPSISDASRGYNPLRGAIGALSEMLQAMRMLTRISGADASVEPGAVVQHIDEALRKLATAYRSITQIGHRVSADPPAQTHSVRRTESPITMPG